MSYADIKKQVNKARSKKIAGYKNGGSVGGNGKKSSTVVNVIVPSRGESASPIAGSAGAAPSPSRMPPPPVAPPAPPMAPPGAGQIPPAAAQAALSAMGGGKPIMKNGGKVQMKAGAGGGLGRLEKAKKAR